MQKHNLQFGPGFFGCLALIFIVLKLTGYIQWPWVWVLAPLWLPAALILTVTGAIALALLLMDKTKYVIKR